MEKTALILQMFVMCLFIDMYPSNVTPMFFVDVHGWMVELDISIFMTGFKSFGDLIINSSVLLPFSFNV